MRPLSPIELDRMQVTANAAMLDTCRILPYVAGTKDGYNRPGISYGTPGPVTPCTVLAEAPSEYQTYGQQTPRATLRIRLPLGTAVSNQDRIHLMMRFGHYSEPLAVYQVIGQPEQMIDAVEVPVEMV